jgi:hypothetical protein
MGLFANRWRALREAASTEVASLHVQPQQAPAPEPTRRGGKLRAQIVMQQDELRA